MGKEGEWQHDETRSAVRLLGMCEGGVQFISHVQSMQVCVSAKPSLIKHCIVRHLSPHIAGYVSVSRRI